MTERWEDKIFCMEYKHAFHEFILVIISFLSLMILLINIIWWESVTKETMKQTDQHVSWEACRNFL
jgi:hypothetical protein